MVRPHPKEEMTFMLIKPDGVVRGLVGEILKRIEQRGLKIVALGMEQASKEKVDGHYPKDEGWIRRLGEKTLATYQKFGYDSSQEMGTEDPDEIGKMVREWLVLFMSSSPVVKVAIKGVHAIEMVRKIAGPTMPADAPIGTIRGDFSVDSAALANRDRRAVRNIVHISETQDEAQHEIKYWFGNEKIHDYERSDESVMF